MRGIKSNSQQNRLNHFVGISIVLSILLPHSNTLLQVVNPLLCLALAYYSKRKTENTKFLVVIPVIFSLLINLSGIQLKAFFSVVSLLLYFSLFPIVGKVKIYNVYLYVSLSVILLSQIVYALGIPFLVNFFDTVYPISEDSVTGAAFRYTATHVTMDTLYDYRLGGLYHNPNICSEFLTFLLAFYLVQQENFKRKVTWIFPAVAFFAIIFTGSRTGFAIFVVIVMSILYVKKELNNIYIIIAVVAAIVYIFVVAENSIRVLDIEGGMNSSANLKWETFVHYLITEQSAIRYLFGYADLERFEVQNSSVMGAFDSDYGYLIFCYGFIGFIGIMMFCLNIGKKLSKTNRLFLLLLLWMVSNTIFMSYRASFTFLLLLSVLYSNIYPIHHAISIQK